MTDTDTSYLRPLMHELVAAYLLGDPARVAEVADRIEDSGRIPDVLTEANRYGENLSGRFDCTGDPVSPEFIGAGIRARLATVLSPHEELAAMAALDDFAATRDKPPHTTPAPGSIGAMLLLHVAAAGIAELGTRVFGPTEFTPERVASIADLASEEPYDCIEP
ncbi:hypothetical protein ACIP5Y_31510 [Nocardia sp. NPDC088792]|uniref:hypothetical protein n=1 Tax=Nocardia sp. NPDC088792 TaxID=3364332 RepID=UPI003808D224